MKDPYIILGISKNASIEELKIAYRKLCLQYHPDVCSDDNATEKMAEINCAYEFLKEKYEKQKKQTKSGNFKNSYASSKQNSNNANKNSNDTNKKTYTKEEWNSYWKSFWEKYKAGQSAYYANIGIKMKERLKKKLEPIRRENNNFEEQVKASKNYNELLEICHNHFKKVSEIIQYMYLYTEKCHKYGLPTYYKFGHTTFNPDIKVDKNFPLEEINSSHIKAIGYDIKNNVLYIKFSNETIYVYYCVSPNLFYDFKNSSSKGKFFEDYIRNEYDYRRIV